MVPRAVLVLSEDFPAGPPADAVGVALARGLGSNPTLECDLCPVGAHAARTAPGPLLEQLGFDRRLRAARCLVIAAGRLADDTLAGSLAFEAATRARQGGVPACAVTAHHRLDPFEARIVDLQVVLEAGSARALAAAGRKLATLI